MKKINHKFLVFSVALALFLAACQKEQITPTISESNAISEVCQYSIFYWINDVCYSTHLKDKAEVGQLIQMLSTLAVEGNVVSIGNNDIPSSKASLEDERTFQSSDFNEFNKWVEEMILDDYEVKWSYDKENGLYIGTATKK